MDKEFFEVIEKGIKLETIINWYNHIKIKG